ncbi:CopM family metallochaperone [Paracoccus benzoatiresistens]|uniref:DUF305 domain-containing protein n=1 Tax=Paracoccus benzoatiresistens TaxID=2997341 RepID=A0ABT4J7S5_9RHOB|nr:DUF305 domain-containing protein [Paracoccus sp. EF6]MCZ0963183.1 DUF305 domain-containing protein [Paracoccus sp. EF6]
MRKFEIAAILAAFLAVPAAFAQDSATDRPAGRPDHARGPHAQTADLSVLPQGCRDAIQQSGMGGMMGGMDMPAMMGGMGGMDEAQKAYMQTMMKMNMPMMAAHSIKDPDLAFHCGMIAHHTGAIAMAEIELKYGNDEQSKAMAQKIIDAQGPEIEEMTAWVEKNAGQQ